MKPPIRIGSSRIPKELETLIRSHRDTFSGPKGYSIAAALLVAHFLGRHPEELISKLTKSDGSLKSAANVTLMTAISASLYELRHEQGFQEFCRRWSGRDPRATFMEILAAAHFKRIGFRLFARPETGRKGEDFDFYALKDGRRVNVEVTELKATSLSESNIKNALKKKKSQLPDTHPAVVFLAIPSDFRTEQNATIRIVDTIIEFFSTTRRLNAVVIITEYKNSLENGDALFAFSTQVIINSSARHEWPDVLLLPGPSTLGWPIKDGAPIDPHAQPVGPFFDWARRVLGEPTTQSLGSD